VGIAMYPTKTVEEISSAIERYQYLSSKDLATMRARWFRPDRKDVKDPEQFRRWLVLNKYLSEFVAKVLSGRKSDQLASNQYRLVDQMISGPMAGSYLAIDSLDRSVAIEVLSANSAADKALLTEFQQSARLAMEVQHPNVGRILDVGEAHGFHYLVKEHYEGQTLEDILKRRSKLPHQQAARLMALALAGVEALHEHGVPAGDLTADCIMLTSASKQAPNQRTVKILHAGVKRRLFDETAIGRSISIVQGIPDELELACSCTFEVGKAGAPNRTDDIFRLGCLFYQCVTGRAPYARDELPEPQQAAPPVCKVAPEVPEMLGQIIDGMIDPVPANRPQKAAHVAKSLRVFLAADEEGHEAKAEEHIVAPRERPSATAEEVYAVAVEEGQDQAVEEEEEEQEEAAPRRRARPRATAEPQGPWEKVVALWNEVHPEIRDLLFLSSGILLTLVVIFLGEVLTGLRVTYIAGLATGAAATYLVEVFLRWRHQKKVATEATE
jgi:serine/threonine protein kinase